MLSYTYILTSFSNINCSHTNAFHLTSHRVDYMWSPRMHGHSKLAAAPVSDAAKHKGHCCLCVELLPVFVFFVFFFPFRDMRRHGLIRSVSDRIGRNRRYRPKFKLNKKSAKRTISTQTNLQNRKP